MEFTGQLAYNRTALKIKLAEMDGPMKNLLISTLTLTSMMLIGIGASLVASPSLASFAQRTDVSEFIDSMVTKYDFDRNTLVVTLDEVEIQTNVLTSMSQPFEAKPWYVYRDRLVTPAKVASGVAFWKQHERVLQRAEQVYGVPANILVAVLGIETNYGENQGAYPVLDTLATLAFEYPRRAKFFKRELAQFLLLTREQAIEPRSVYGSYAGAIGQCQFISSSYRHYAVDFSGSGTIDLRNDTVDAIGSVANFLQRHGWQSGAPVAVEAQVSGVKYKNIDTKQRKPSLTIKQLKDRGVKSDEPSITEEMQAILVALKNQENTEYWFGFYNFYVITRYNTSEKYAMAVYQLAEEILAEHG